MCMALDFSCTYDESSRNTPFEQHYTAAHRSQRLEAPTLNRDNITYRTLNGRAMRFAQRGWEEVSGRWRGGKDV
jgi:hypothetical protein